MAARKTRSKKGAPAARRAQLPPQPPEERSAEAATVAWMLAAVASLSAQLVALAARLAWWDTPPGEVAPIGRILPGWFLLCAVLTGLLALVLTPLVYRVRRVAPPWPITLGVILISLAPLVTLLVLAV